MSQDDYMSDAESPAEDSTEPKEEDQGTKTALLPLDFLAGKKLNPGDMITLKVAKVGDDQIEVELASDAQEESQEKETPAPAPQGGMEEMMG